ncbi:MAG: phosphate ABC transporter substrate-binding protein PstS [Alkalinema sp. RU_4_3]|nr:phosphate ABC transporter substrate-binding protein PstS [Alkalinema sp. RU_4_3]
MAVSQVFSIKTVRRAVATSAMAAVIIVMPALSAIVQAVEIKGAGATFPDLLYQEYIKQYRSANSKDRVSYQAIGSGGGIRQTIAGIVQFGGSDAGMTAAQQGQGEAGKRGIVLVPTAGGSVVPVINVSGVSDLKLSREALAGIFSGKVTKWNDAKIKDANPGLNLPDAEIKTVVRADSSGTTFIFVNHLATVDRYFKGSIGGSASTAPTWKVDGLKGRGNAGVASLVKQTPNSIGYVEYSYAKKNSLTEASVQDASGSYVKADLQKTNDAIASMSFGSDLQVFDGNPSKGYPITGVTWMMFYKKYKNAEEANAVKAWANWVLGNGQNLNNGLDFAKIPDSIVGQARSAVNQIGN